MMRAVSSLVVYMLLCLQVLISPAPSQESPELSDTLDELSQAIKQAGYVRVAVEPSFSTSDGVPDSQPVVTSPTGLYLASVVQAGLVARKGGAYQVVDTDVLANALHKEGLDSTRDLDRLRQLAEKIGGLDAIVVGKLQTDWTESRDAGPSSTLQVECKLLETRTGNVQSDKRERRTLTLADEVYSGKSIEVLRPSEEGFLPIGLRDEFTRDSTLEIPLSPRSSAAYYDFHRPHPLANPKCPFRVKVLVNNEVRAFVDRPRMDDVYVPIEPGESFVVNVENTLDRRVRVAVFVDGFNIRGKRRELPDEHCHAWVLAAHRQGNFRGFYDETTPTPTVSPFVMVPIEDSVAIREGFTQHLGQITVVVFHWGWPGPDNMVRPSDAYNQYVYSVIRTWNAAQQMWEYKEQWSEIKAVGREGDSSPFAVGWTTTEPAPLEYHKVQPGPILAAITFRYATQSEIDRLIPQDQ